MSRSRAPRGRRLSPAQRRNQLIQQGIELLGDGPWGQLSCERIARGAGVSPGLLYRYFPSKRDFLATILSEIVRRLEACSPGGEPFAAGPGPWLAARVAFAEASPGLYRLLLAHGSDPELGAPLVGLRGRDARRLAALGPRAGTPVARARAVAWLGACETLLLHWLDERELGREELVRVLAAGLDRVPGRTPSRLKPRLRLVPVTRPPGDP